VPVLFAIEIGGRGLRGITICDPHPLEQITNSQPAPPPADRFHSNSSKKHPGIKVQPARLAGARVQVAARHGDVAMPERRLHYRQRCAVVVNPRWRGCHASRALKTAPNPICDGDYQSAGKPYYRELF
jgi:hypothetical protein